MAPLIGAPEVHPGASLRLDHLMRLIHEARLRGRAEGAQGFAHPREPLASLGGLPAYGEHAPGVAPGPAPSEGLNPIAQGGSPFHPGRLPLEPIPGAGGGGFVSQPEQPLGIQPGGPLQHLGAPSPLPPFAPNPGVHPAVAAARRALSFGYA